MRWTPFSGIATTVNVIGTQRRLFEEAELLLFRITQEALRNVWRHSAATQADVVVDFNERTIKVTISDNGKGFDFSGSVDDLTRNGKLGLAGMLERSRLLGGDMKVESKPGAGTTITVEIPT